MGNVTMYQSTFVNFQGENGQLEWRAIGSFTLTKLKLVLPRGWQAGIYVS